MGQKNRRITFRLSEDEYQALMEKCKFSNSKPSGFILKAVNDMKIIVIPEIKEFRTELRHIGNNLNQLTILANKGLAQFFNLEEMNNSLNNIWKAMSKLRK